MGTGKSLRFSNHFVSIFFQSMASFIDVPHPKRSLFSDRFGCEGKFAYNRFMTIFGPLEANDALFDPGVNSSNRQVLTSESDEYKKTRCVFLSIFFQSPLVSVASFDALFGVRHLYVKI